MTCDQPLDTETKGFTEFRDLKALWLECSKGATKGLRVSIPLLRCYLLHTSCLFLPFYTAVTEHAASIRELIHWAGPFQQLRCRGMSRGDGTLCGARQLLLDSSG